MNDYLSPHIQIVALTFFLAGIVKGVTEMGLPTVAMGILGAITSPVSAASLLVIPSFITNFWQLFTGPDFLTLMKRLWLMMLGIVVGTLAGSWLLTSANTEFASVGLGSALVLYAVHSLWATRSREVPIPHDETIYKLRNRIERCFNKLKHFRRFATRYDRRADYFLAFVHLAAICMWMNLAPVNVDSS